MEKRSYLTLTDFHTSQIRKHNRNAASLQCSKEQNSCFVTLLTLCCLPNLQPPHLFARPEETGTAVQDPQDPPANVQTSHTKAFSTSAITERQCAWQRAAAAGAALAGEPWPRHGCWSDWEGQSALSYLPYG